jgi:uncharacterized glyoxalase superfamily protein PhnB
MEEEDDETTTLHGYLSYRDAFGAIAWLEAVGFRVISRQDGADGTVQHAELRLGAAVVMVASVDQDYDVPALRDRSVGQGLYLRTDRVDELYERALSAGGRSVIAPEDTAWGSRRARVLDPEGREWSFGSYEPGRAG